MCSNYADNHVHDMQDAGLAVLESFDAEIYDNIFENVKYGIRISLGGSNNYIHDNTFDDCSQCEALAKSRVHTVQKKLKTNIAVLRSEQKWRSTKTVLGFHRLGKCALCFSSLFCMPILHEIFETTVFRRGQFPLVHYHFSRITSFFSSSTHVPPSLIVSHSYCCICNVMQMGCTRTRDRMHLTCMTTDVREKTISTTIRFSTPLPASSSRKPTTSKLSVSSNFLRSSWSSLFRAINILQKS